MRKTITEIANEIGHSQPSVTKIIQEMTAVNLVREKTGIKRQAQERGKFDRKRNKTFGKAEGTMCGYRHCDRRYNKRSHT